MLLHIAFFMLVRSSGQVITTPLDVDFGRVDHYRRTAGVFWAYFLVDPWSQDGLYFTGRGLTNSARLAYEDLWSRLNRPIFTEIVHGNYDPHPTDGKDDLAAGIAFWTLQWKADANGRHEMWEKFHKRAEDFLLKASHEGDAIQQSFASLAYAYCPFRNIHDRVGGKETDPLWPSREARLAEHHARLICTYNQFKTSVPERALRAVYQLEWLASDQDRRDEARHWHQVIINEFGSLQSWYSYRGG